MCAPESDRELRNRLERLQAEEQALEKRLAELPGQLAAVSAEVELAERKASFVQRRYWTLRTDNARYAEQVKLVRNPPVDDPLISIPLKIIGWSIAAMVAIAILGMLRGLFR